MAFIYPSDLTGVCDGLFYCLGLWLRDVTNGIFWPMALLGFCLICFISTIRFFVPRAFGFASFVGMLGAIFLATMKYMSWWVSSIFILAGAIGMAVLALNER